MSPVLDQRDKPNLREGARAATGPGAPKGVRIALLIGDIQSTAVYADQMPTPIPAPRFRRPPHRADHGIMQGLQRFGPQARPGLRDTRPAHHPGACRRVAQPLQAFQQAAQDLAVRRLHVERQSDHVIDHHVRGQVPLTDTLPTRRLQGRVHRGPRDHRVQHPEAEVVRDPAPLGKLRNRSCHRLPLAEPRGEYSAKTLSEQYWG